MLVQHGEIYLHDPNILVVESKVLIREGCFIFRPTRDRTSNNEHEVIAKLFSLKPNTMYTDRRITTKKQYIFSCVAAEH